MSDSQGESLREVIKESRLPFYQQAARVAGVRLKVVGRAGDSLSYERPAAEIEDTGKMEFASMNILEGEVAVEIGEPGQDLSGFWEELRRIEGGDSGEPRSGIKLI